MLIIYQVILAVWVFATIPILFIKKKWHPGFFMRLGKVPPEFKNEIQGKENLWIHAVSVGEVLAVIRLIRQIKLQFPRYHIILSTVTKTGFQVAKNYLKNGESVIYAPLDFQWIVKKYYDEIQPKAYISAETEIWPSLFHELKNRDVPVIIINGRISDKSYQGYRQVKVFLKKFLQNVDLFCMQSELDAVRIRDLGALTEKVHVVGNVKFDELPDSTFPEMSWRHKLKDSDFFVAGSTHKGEEEILLQAYHSLSQEFPELRLVIAPRHTERTDEICQLIESKGYVPLRLSGILAETIDPKGIVVVDTMGQLRSLYSIAKIVFVGKSLIPGGGQNVIEPASFGKPVIVGPYMENFRDIMNIFLKAEAVIQVKDSQEFQIIIRGLLNNPQQLLSLGNKASEVVIKQQGVTNKTLQLLSQVLPA